MLFEKVQDTLTVHRMLQPGDQVLVAVSGGPDSVALCHLLQRLRPSYHLELLAAHIHHGLRGAEADEDARFVEDFCRRFHIPVVVHHLPVHAWRQRHGGSLQMAARTLRYQYLHQAMMEREASKLALGHTADDQAEEVLLRLFRGAGPRGLAGMPACNRKGVIRPLIDCHRLEIMNYLDRYGLAFRQDSSNLKPWCQRNLLRLEFLPRLERYFNSKLNATLVRTTKIFQEEGDFWDSLLGVWFEQHVCTAASGGLQLPLEPLLSSHPAMQRRLLRRVVEQVAGSLRGLAFQHTEMLLHLCQSAAASCQIQLPGMVVAEKNYGRLTVALKPKTAEDFHYEISGPGVHFFPLLEHSLEIQLLEDGADVQFSGDPTEVMMDEDQVSFPLYLRSSKPGDRFRPLGLGGAKKVKDFFIDAKVARRLRRQIPILCSKEHIAWIVGYRLDDRVKITPETRRILRFVYRKASNMRHQE